MNNEEVVKQMQALINQLNEASESYYNGTDELMSNKEWDEKFDKLAELEAEFGIIRPDSPTQKVGSEVDGKIKGTKVQHEFPALSLDKTKSMDDLIKWADGRKCILSWKLDGLTLVLTYDKGKLSQITTRGDGYVGTDITRLKDAISGIPKKIEYKGHLVVRGECVISYADFERINNELPQDKKPYENPRNLASGTLTLDDVDEVKRRNPQFIAFTLVHADEPYLTINGRPIYMNSWLIRMNSLNSLGFNIVPNISIINPEDLPNEVAWFTSEVSKYQYPVDGLVICYDDWEYSQSGNVTGHHATRAGYAFKWADKTVETVITDIEWSDSRTGLFNPVAVFEPVQLCGTTVTRASLFNLSYVRAKDIKIGDRVTVYKSNMIIPQVDKNLDADVQTTTDWDFICKRHNIHRKCPHCGNPLTVARTGSADLVTCSNPNCSAKVIGNMVHFCERGCMNIMGLSRKKLQSLLDLGVIERVSDIPALFASYQKGNNDILFTDEFGAECNLSTQPGWGKESVENLAVSVQTACERATFVSFIHAMGIPNVGRGQAKLLAPAVAEWMKQNPMSNDTPDELIYALGCMVRDGYDFTSIDGIGKVIADSLTTWAEKELVPYVNGSMTEVGRMLRYVFFVDRPDDYIKVTNGSPIIGKTFVVTGDVHIFKNRKEVESKIEELGGKLAGSVSKKTDYLINNDIESTSSKNKKAKSIGIPIITEEQFCEMIGI